MRPDRRRLRVIRPRRRPRQPPDPTLREALFGVLIWALMMFAVYQVARRLDVPVRCCDLAPHPYQAKSR